MGWSPIFLCRDIVDNLFFVGRSLKRTKKGIFKIFKFKVVITPPIEGNIKLIFVSLMLHFEIDISSMAKIIYLGLGNRLPWIGAFPSAGFYLNEYYPVTPLGNDVDFSSALLRFPIHFAQRHSLCDKVSCRESLRILAPCLSLLLIFLEYRGFGNFRMMSKSGGQFFTKLLRAKR